jgi:hypothetical protein
MLDEISEGRSGWPSRWSRGRQGTSRASPTDSKVTAARLVVRNGHANPRTISTAAGASQKGPSLEHWLRASHRKVFDTSITRA